MNLKTLIIHKNKTLYNILEEVSSYINYRIIYSESLDLNLAEFKNYIVLTPKKLIEIKNQVVVDFLPLKLNKLIEIININFLQQEYNFQSSINVSKYELDLNARVLKFDQNKLSLTEMEANIILFLIKSNKPVNIKKLQEKVWGHMSDLETHTVETHIYRLRKKIKNKFQDNNLIISLKNGYQIV
jgi:hypothetical protein